MVDTFLEQYSNFLNGIFNDIDNAEFERRNPSGLIDNLLFNNKPLAVFIPKEFNGLSGQLSKIMTLLESTAYYSIPLSLFIAINGVLFLEPIIKYLYDSNLKKDIIKDFIFNKKLGGLMVTEPQMGTNALSIETSYELINNYYHIKGNKHWAGLTGKANYWLIAARQKRKKGLGHKLNLFIINNDIYPVKVKETYPSLGLYWIPYGKSSINHIIPYNYILGNNENNNNYFSDIIYRGRLHISSTAAGCLKRILHDIIPFCHNRYIGKKELLSFDQVQYRIAKIQAYHTAIAAICFHFCKNYSISDDLSENSIEANVSKTISTDFMQIAAQSFLQLKGAQGYRLDEYAGRAAIDTRPYLIFEGPNDLLYEQVTNETLKKLTPSESLYNYLKEFIIYNKALDLVKNTISFKIDIKNKPQSHRILLGQVISRLIVIDWIINLEEHGYSKLCVKNAIQTLVNEIGNIVNKLHQNINIKVVEENYITDWQSCL